MRVLVVDDEEALLRVVERTMKTCGVEVFTASDAQRALDIADREQIDVVLTDFGLPKQNGADLLLEIQQRHPRMVRILMSGSMDCAPASTADFYLEKPWPPGELQRVLADAAAMVRR
jgi:adenylate cyclase